MMGIMYVFASTWARMAVATALLTAACGGRSELFEASDASASADANGADTMLPACDPTTPFGSPTPIDAVNTPFGEYEFRLSPDELTAYFTSAQPDDAGMMNWQVYVATRKSTAESFGNIEVDEGLTEPNSGSTSPSISSDGRLLLYESGCVTGIQQGGNGFFLCQSTRDDTSIPFSMGTSVSIHAWIGGPSYMLPDGLAVYFTAAELPGYGIGVSRRTNLDPAFGSATKVPIDGIVEDAQHQSSDPVVTPDEHLLFFSRPETFTVQHIWQASRASSGDAFGGASIVQELASALGEAPTWISPDGCRLYFSRVMSNSNTDIYVASRPLK